MSLRVLYIHRTRSRDGQSIHIDELIAALQRQGHAVDSVGPRRIDAMADGIERKMLPKPIYELAELAYSAVEFVKLWRAASRRKPDLIYQRANVHMLGALWAARLLGIPLVLEVNAPLARERSSLQGFAWPGLARWSERLLWRHADILLPVTEVLAREMEEAGAARKKIVVMANGVDPARFQGLDRPAAKRALGLADELILGFVGYVREWHGLEQVIDLLGTSATLANARLIVVGDGPACPALMARAVELGVGQRIIFTGVLAHGEVACVAAAFDIALQPHVTSYASPLKIFEYMALGQAIVAPDTPNIREILSDGDTALLFAPGNFAAFGNAVQRLARDPSLRTALGQAAAREIAAEDRTWDGNATRIATLLDQGKGRAAAEPALTASAGT